MAKKSSGKKAAAVAATAGGALITLGISEQDRGAITGGLSRLLADT